MVVTGKRLHFLESTLSVRLNMVEPNNDQKHQQARRQINAEIVA
jgi:hypothetical protein